MADIVSAAGCVADRSRYSIPAVAGGGAQWRRWLLPRTGPPPARHNYGIYHINLPWWRSNLEICEKIYDLRSMKRRYMIKKQVFFFFLLGSGLLFYWHICPINPEASGGGGGGGGGIKRLPLLCRAISQKRCDAGVSKYHYLLGTNRKLWRQSLQILIEILLRYWVFSDVTISQYRTINDTSLKTRVKSHG